MKKPRIEISGPSGVGKTTLAKEIAKMYDIPFISTSGKSLWPKYNIVNHEHLIDICNKDIGFSIRYQDELLDLRYTQLKEHDCYVTDRGIMDNLVYFLLQNQTAKHAEYMRYLERCKKYSKTLDSDIIQLGLNQTMLNLQPIEDDGNRIVNPLYQLMVHSVFNMVIDNNLLDLSSKKILSISSWDLDYKKQFIDRWLREK